MNYGIGAPGYPGAYPNPYYQPYDPLATNVARMQQMMQQNPQLAQQYAPQMQQQQQTQQAQQPQVRGALVTGIEEVKGMQIAFDGSTYVFPDSSGGKIYTKRIGNNGAPIYDTYALQPPEDAAQPVQAVPSTDMLAPAIAALGGLTERMAAIELKIDTMIGGATNGHATNHAVGRAGAGKRQPNANAITDGGE
jgi:hypothetical protein